MFKKKVIKALCKNVSYEDVVTTLGMLNSTIESALESDMLDEIAEVFTEEDGLYTFVLFSLVLEGLLRDYGYFKDYKKMKERVILDLIELNKGDSSILSDINSMFDDAEDWGCAPVEDDNDDDYDFDIDEDEEHVADDFDDDFFDSDFEEVSDDIDDDDNIDAEDIFDTDDDFDEDEDIFGCSEDDTIFDDSDIDDDTFDIDDDFDEDEDIFGCSEDDTIFDDSDIDDDTFFTSDTDEDTSDYFGSFEIALDTDDNIGTNEVDTTKYPDGLIESLESAKCNLEAMGLEVETPMDSSTSKEPKETKDTEEIKGAKKKRSRKKKDKDIKITTSKEDSKEIGDMFATFIGDKVQDDSTSKSAKKSIGQNGDPFENVDIDLSIFSNCIESEDDTNED